MPISIKLLVALLVSALALWGQAFDSGSDGSDGALNLTLPQPGVIEFDLADPTHPIFGPMDADKDNVFHFTSVNIGPNVTLKMRASLARSKPIVWLSQGDVVIDGIIDMNGADG